MDTPITQESQIATENVSSLGDTGLHAPPQISDADRLTKAAGVLARWLLSELEKEHEPRTPAAETELREAQEVE
jgi:hypothetical protein